MEFLKNAEIRQEDGRVIRTHVTVSESAPVTGPGAGTTDWQGLLYPPNNTGLTVGERYFLFVPDIHGRPSFRGTIEIMDDANPIDGTVPFLGIGGLPATEQALVDR